MTLTLGSLFDGSGGFPLAGSMCGIEPIWASEVEPYPIAVTSSRFPLMEHLGSVTDINGAEVEPVDIITFGSPCQDLSVAGKRAGLKHEANGDDETTRSGLFMEAIRIIKEMREATNANYPKWAVWENVPGAFSSNQGEDFRIVLEELIKTVEPDAVMPSVPAKGWPYADCYYGDGWSLAYRVLDAQFWGVPQRRRRIYLVLDLTGQRAGSVLFEREGLRGHFAESRTAWQAAPGNAENCTGAADREGTLFQPMSLMEENWAESDVKNSLRAGESKVSHVVCQPVIASAGFKSGQGVKARSIGWEEEISPTLASEAGGNSVPAVCVKCYESHPMDSRIKELEDDVSPTVSVKWHKGAADTPLVCTCEPIPIHDKATRYQGGGPTRKGDGAGNGLGVGKPGDPVPTLSTCDRHMVAYSIENHPADSRVNIDESGKVQTLTSRMGTGGGNVPKVLEEQPVYCLQGNGIDRADTAGCNGEGWKEDTCYTLNTIDRPAVAYLASGKDSVGTLTATAGTKLWLGNQEAFSGDFTIIEEYDVPVRYIVRRLTPTECARLQGFPDWWGHPDHMGDFTEEEYQFWLNVRNTHAAINGKKVQEYTEAQMLTWYNKLHTDSAEYKLWGNGIALPCALYVMEGIAEVSKS